MIYQSKKYIEFLRRSKNQHGIHSPFVYQLWTHCVYDRKKKPSYAILKKYRKQLLSSKQKIEVTDFGAGSRVFTSNKRSVAAIVKNAGMRPKRLRLLYRICTYFMPLHTLELGTSLGLATTAMALGNPDGTITTIEGCPMTAQVAQQAFTANNLKNITLFNTTFETYFSDRNNAIFDLVFIDGNHNKEHTLQYFNTLLQKKHNESIFIFDDIYWSKEMTEAWNTIKQHPDVTVTIDTYQWGIVFFRKEQCKEHFVLRV